MENQGILLGKIQKINVVRDASNPQKQDVTCNIVDVRGQVYSNIKLYGLTGSEAQQREGAIAAFHYSLSLRTKQSYQTSSGESTFGLYVRDIGYIHNNDDPQEYTLNSFNIEGILIENPVIGQENGQNVADIKISVIRRNYNKEPEVKNGSIFETFTLRLRKPQHVELISNCGKDSKITVSGRISPKPDNYIVNTEITGLQVFIQKPLNNVNQVNSMHQGNGMLSQETQNWNNTNTNMQNFGQNNNGMNNFTSQETQNWNNSNTNTQNFGQNNNGMNNFANQSMQNNNDTNTNIQNFGQNNNGMNNFANQGMQNNNNTNMQNFGQNNNGMNNFASQETQNWNNTNTQNFGQNNNGMNNFANQGMQNNNNTNIQNFGQNNNGMNNFANQGMQNNNNTNMQNFGQNNNGMNNFANQGMQNNNNTNMQNFGQNNNGMNNFANQGMQNNNNTNTQNFGQNNNGMNNFSQAQQEFNNQGNSFGYQA